MGGSPKEPEAEGMYSELAPRLRQIVARNVNAPAGLVEDACQVAWSRWLTRRDHVAATSTLGWLATTATREALRMLRSQKRELSLDAPIALRGNVVQFPTQDPGPDRIVELRERLAEVRRLPVRQQRMVWMRGFGYDYREIGAQTGDSYRTVERQLEHARKNLSDAG